jgi:hypothetical protein
MNFLRESEIRNSSMLIKSGLTSEQTAANGLQPDENGMILATDYYLDFCFKKERQYNKMRVDMPDFFQGAKSYIDVMESGEICDKLYVGEFGNLQELCRTALNGILNKGLTNAFYYMFTQILKENLRFSELGPTAARNDTVLRNMLLDPSINQIIDMKAKVIEPALN